jgi:hypothetical protein
VLLLCGALCLLAPGHVEAQTRTSAIDDAAPQGLFPDASFDAVFRKHTPPRNVFSPYYSWDAHMALDVTVVRRGRGALTFSSLFQSVGTENITKRVSVGGTGYLLGLGYVHTRSEGFQLSSGLAHFSSHLTRDLDDKTDEQRANGAPIPHVDDPSEYNVLYVRGHWTLPSRPFTPELELVIQPINFRFDGRRADYVRPVYLGTRWTLWRGARQAVLAETQQEIGKASFINLSLVFALSPRHQTEGPFQVFVSGSPGGSVRVSPRIGALRGGLAFGIRMRFRA